MVAPLYNECMCLRCWRRDSIASLVNALQFSAVDRFRRIVCCRQKCRADETDETAVGVVVRKDDGGGGDGDAMPPLWWIKAAVAQIGRRRSARSVDVVELGNQNESYYTQENLRSALQGRCLYSCHNLRIPTVEYCSIACVSSSLVSRGGMNRLNVRLCFKLMLTERLVTKVAANSNLYSVEWRDEIVGCGARLKLLLADSISSSAVVAAVYGNKNHGSCNNADNKQPLLRVYGGTALSRAPLPEFTLRVEQVKLFHVYNGYISSPPHTQYEHFSANAEIHVLLESQFV